MTEEEREAEQVRIWHAIKELVADLKDDNIFNHSDREYRGPIQRICKNAAYLESQL